MQQKWLGFSPPQLPVTPHSLLNAALVKFYILGVCFHVGHQSLVNKSVTQSDSGPTKNIHCKMAIKRKPCMKEICLVSSPDIIHYVYLYMDLPFAHSNSLYVNHCWHMCEYNEYNINNDCRRSFLLPC